MTVTLTDDDINRIAWNEILASTRATLHEWLVTDTYFLTSEDEEQVFDRQQEIIEELEAAVGMLLDG